MNVIPLTPTSRNLRIAQEFAQKLALYFQAMLYLVCADIPQEQAQHDVLAFLRHASQLDEEEQSLVPGLAETGWRLEACLCALQQQAWFLRKAAPEVLAAVYALMQWAHPEEHLECTREFLSEFVGTWNKHEQEAALGLAGTPAVREQIERLFQALAIMEVSEAACLAYSGDEQACAEQEAGQAGKQPRPGAAPAVDDAAPSFF